MKSNRILFLLMAVFLFTACDTGKYYAKKKINRHYDEIVENKVPVTEPVVTEVKEESPSTPTIAPVLNAEQINDAPVTGPTLKTETAQKAALVRDVKNTESASTKHHQFPSLKPALKHFKAVKEQAGEKTVGKGLAMILVALLLLLLGLIFLALGDLGIIFAIIFYIGAAVLLVAGIIVMFIGN